MSSVVNSGTCVAFPAHAGCPGRPLVQRERPRMPLLGLLAQVSTRDQLMSLGADAGHFTPVDVAV